MKHGLQSKLILTFLLTSVLILAVNLFLFLNINRTIGRIDRVYLSNLQISLLSDSLSDTQEQVTDYLSTKSSESLGRFYEAEGRYSSLLSEIRLDEESGRVQVMLADIRHISENYLATCEDTLSAKRGRNIQKYRASYDDASQLYEYLDNYLYSLNNVQLGNNSANYAALRQSFHSLELITLFSLIAVTLANLLITLALTKALTDPLSILAGQANEISAGNFDVPELEVRSGDEIGIVSAAFNEMAVSIRGYIAKLRESMENESRMKERELLMDSHLKEAELKYLQAQINPHFLFNTLNAGAQLAMMDGSERCYRYLQNVASFFRNKTNREKQVTTLADEIALVDNYLYIINVRFSGEISYDKRVDDDLTGILVPSMILQPIVENAVNHGVRDIDWPPRIILSVYRTGDSVTIAVRDNGRGMTAGQIEDILAGRTSARARGDETNGVGLGNVVSRLQLFYDREDVFDITSAGPDKGTEVLLYLPMESPDRS
ncbi:sensor histidine kinase [Lachnoclostridium sp. Marseille-P6806]|uniref:sensor histidine kinase n=1 Tax=Lachnoclostridium sp. Marseille-P6806 TaxID=2364793 RepID=UPI00102F36FC|nr:histidine kinase [Lachnoclostridium sp. Marseille-P6806]